MNLLAQLKDKLQEKLPKEIYKTWFQSLDCEGDLVDNKWTLVASNTFAVIFLKNNYGRFLEDMVHQLVGHPVMLEIKAPPGEDQWMEEADVGAPQAVKTVRPGNRLQSGFGLLAKYTFDTFVVGDDNRFAYAAAVAVSKAPGKAYNPLFVYGNIGLGKTHLMQATGNYILQKNPQLKVIYITTERFTNDFISAIQANQVTKFRRKYRSADVLLIDDIQFLSGKERIQEEIFHTFNELFESGRQIFLCSDRPAAEIAKLESRLVSRFQWGLDCDVKAPDFETRVAILTKKAQAMQLVLNEEAIVFLAHMVTSNVRRIEGALNRVAGYQQLLGTTDLSRQTLEEILEDILVEEMAMRVTIEEVQMQICGYFQVNLRDLLSKKRPANIAFPRQVGMYLCRLLTQASLEEIGEAFGGRDHVTVIHACKTIEKAIERDPKIKRMLAFLQRKLCVKEDVTFSRTFTAAADPAVSPHIPINDACAFAPKPHNPPMAATHAHVPMEGHQPPAEAAPKSMAFRDKSTLQSRKRLHDQPPGRRGYVR